MKNTLAKTVKKPVHIECYLYVLWSAYPFQMNHVQCCILVSSVQNHKLNKHTKLLSFEWNGYHFFMSDALFSYTQVCVYAFFCLEIFIRCSQIRTINVFNVFLKKKIMLKRFFDSMADCTQNYWNELFVCIKVYKH